MSTVKTYPGLFQALFNELAPVAREISVSKSPSVNVLEKDDNYFLQLAAPGLKKDDFKIEFHKKTLTISTTKENEEGKKYLKKEFDFSNFKRTFTIPSTIDVDKIEASYENGILELTLPKKEEAKEKEPQSISVA